MFERNKALTFWLGSLLPTRLSWQKLLVFVMSYPFYLNSGSFKTFNTSLLHYYVVVIFVFSGNL